MSMFNKPVLMNAIGDADGGGGFDSEVDSDSGIGGETGEDAEGISAESAEPTPAEIKKTVKKLKLKFNGKEIEEDLPFEVPEEHAEWLVRQRQMAMLSQHKAQELSSFERQFASFMHELQTNPRKALANPNIGIDLKQLAAEVLEQEILDAQKSPEQKRQEELEAKLKALEEEREQERQSARQAELERLTEREFERYDNLMSNALETSDLPKSAYVVKKMTEYMIEAVENGIDVEPKDVIPLIRNEMLGDVQEMLRTMPPEMVEQILGPEIINALRKNRVAAAKKPPVPVKASVRDVGASSPKEAANKQPQGGKTYKDFFGF